MVDYEDINIQPFAAERYKRSTFSQKRGSIIALELMQAYFNKLFDGEYIIKLPYEDGSAFHRSDEYNSKSCECLRKIKTELHEFVLKYSSFEAHVINFTNFEPDLDMKRTKPSQWNERRRIKEICKSNSILEKDMVKQLFCAFPDPVTACFDYQYGTKNAVYFTSKKVFCYLSFFQQHKDYIQKVFLKEHLKILESLMYISKPITEQKQQYQISYLMERFIIGFSLGGKDYCTTLMEDIDVNFYVALFVLEKLLNLAEKKFYFMDGRRSN